MKSLFDCLYSIICSEIEHFYPNEILSELIIYPYLIKSFESWKGSIVSILKNHNEIDKNDAIKILLGLSNHELVSLISTVMLLIITETGGYQSRTRILLHEISFGILGIDISIIEFRVIELLSLLPNQDSIVKMDSSLSPSYEKQGNDSKKKKILLTGIGALAGGILSGLTAGLATPLIIPALSALIGGGSALLAASSTTAIITSSALFGTAGAGLSAYKIQRRFGDLKDFQFHSLTSSPLSPLLFDNGDYRSHIGLHNILCISGWLRGPDDIVLPWSTLRLSISHSNSNSKSSSLFMDTNRKKDDLMSSNVYSLQFEKDILMDLGTSLKKFAASSAASIATTQILQHTILAGLVSSLIFPLAVIQMGDIIDNPWSMGMERAKSAGIILAHLLKKQYFGSRPIDLYGYSLGALVITSCLEELLRIEERGEEMEEDEQETIDKEKTSVDKTKESENKRNSIQDMIQNVIIFGVPTMAHHDTLRWNKMKSIVPGRFIHCYSRRDWILKFLYRSTSLQFEDIAGLCALKSCPDIESVDLTTVIDGHLEYGEKMHELLDLLLGSNREMNEKKGDILNRNDN